MNPYLKNLNRIEFVITLACTGRCRHCSQGEHGSAAGRMDKDKAALSVRRIAEKYRIESVMTFGGEPLLYPDVVCGIHAAAREMQIPKRQLITNGYFCRDAGKIEGVAAALAESGVNDILLSVDAFHQETIPMEYVKLFAEAVKDTGCRLRTSPAWLVSREGDNPYNRRTREILEEFAAMGIEENDGNVIFPAGNALKYLKEYFEPGREARNPYEEDPEDVRAVCFDPDGGVLGGNLYEQDIRDILASYVPGQGNF